MSSEKKIDKEVEFDVGEYEELLEIIRKFGEKNEEIKDVEKRIDELKSRWTHIMKDLDRLRREEGELMDNIKEKYGEGEIDLKNWKYKVYKNGNG